MHITAFERDDQGESRPACGNLRFLVVEDHEFQLETTTRLLRRLGAEAVHGACDGAGAMRALQDPDRRVDIVLLDLAMPGMDGVELIQRMGAVDAPVAVILNSSFGAAFLETIKLLADGYGVNVLGVAEKPLTPEKLRPLIRLFELDYARTGKAPAPPLGRSASIG